MRNSTKILLAAVAILSALLWFKSCTGGDPKTETIKVTVPAISNELEAQKPQYLPPPQDTVYITRWRSPKGDIAIETDNPVNDSLAQLYQSVKDSLERYKLYLSAIQIRKFKNTFDDEYLALTIEGEVQGELRSIKPTYTIKEREVVAEYAPKVTVFRLLAGGHVQSSVNSLDAFNYSFNLGIQNKKGNILRAGYSKLSGEDYLLVGYDFSLFQIRR